MASRTRRFFLNALSLTATALFMRGVGVAFNIYVSNRAGAEAMGLFSLLSGVYGLFITIAAAGINLGSTRLVAEALGKNDTDVALRAMKRALLYCAVTSLCAFVLLFTFAEFIGSVLLGDSRTVSSLRILALTLPPIAICSCLSGYFNAVRRVKISSASQIFIQGVKIFATGALLYLLLPNGTESACIALVLGGAVAEFVSLLVTASLYFHDKRKHFKNRQIEKNPDISNKDITKKLINITLPVTLSACIRSGLTTIQHILIPRGLKANGASWQSALASYGILHSMVLPVILFPSAFISSFSGLLIPEVTECITCKNYQRLRRIAYRILTLSLIFAIGISGIMIFLSYDIGQVIYDSDEASLYIKILAPLIPIMYIDSAVDAILKGAGHQVYSMNVNIADALTSCVLVILLVPRLGLYGYIISIYATEILNTSLSLWKMLSVTGMRPRIFHQVVMPIICIVGATVVSNIIFRHVVHIFDGTAELILNIATVVIIYILLLTATKTIGKDEREVFRASFLTTQSYRRKYIDHTSKNI